jgi:hypothetical protein
MTFHRPTMAAVVTLETSRDDIDVTIVTAVCLARDMLGCTKPRVILRRD